MRTIQENYTWVRVESKIVGGFEMDANLNCWSLFSSIDEFISNQSIWSFLIQKNGMIKLCSWERIHEKVKFNTKQSIRLNFTRLLRGSTVQYLPSKFNIVSFLKQIESYHLLSFIYDINPTAISNRTRYNCLLHFYRQDESNWKNRELLYDSSWNSGCFALWNISYSQPWFFSDIVAYRMIFVT